MGELILALRFCANEPAFENDNVYRPTYLLAGIKPAAVIKRLVESGKGDLLLRACLGELFKQVQREIYIVGAGHTA